MNLKTFSLDLKNKKRLIPQVLTLLFIVLLISYFTFNAQVNMDNRGIAFGFGFLTQEASFDIGFSLIDYDALELIFNGKSCILTMIVGWYTEPAALAS